MRGRRSRQIPVILQMTVVECGAACLAMVLHAAGRATTLEECRDLLAVGRDGVSAAAIADAATACGLEVAAYRLGADGMPGL
ncbi:MAG TPA: cysteine peptidase family C39 domain-containing protein, partial [Herpetosiphonaceae bacterium]